MATPKVFSQASVPGTLLDRGVTRRATAVVGLGGIALVHVLDVHDKIHELAYVGWLFIALIVGSIVIAEGLIRTDDSRLWLAAGGMAALTIIGYVVSRTVGLPGDHGGDKGNWFESLGLASLMLEAIVVLLTLERLAARRT